MTRKIFTLNGASFSMAIKYGAGAFARLKQTQTVLRQKTGAKTESEFALDFPYDFILSTLEAILTPESDVSIKDGYESASSVEVQAIMDFFSESVTGKIESEPSKTNASKNIKGTRKARR